MNPLRCCVIDDEPLAAELISGYIEKTPSLVLTGTFGSAQDSVRQILNDQTDIVFLDINMPQLNGLEFAKIIPPHVSIIFTTAYENYALESFRVNAVDYLLKPVSYEEFMRSVGKVMRRMEAPVSSIGRPQYLIVKSEYKLVQIDISDILYIEGLKDYVKIVLDDNAKSVMTLMSIRSLEVALPRDRFMRVHRSYIVNTDKIKVIERNRIVFGKTYIPVSDSYKQAFANYIAERTVEPVRGTDL